MASAARLGPAPRTSVVSPHTPCCRASQEAGAELFRLLCRLVLLTWLVCRAAARTAGEETGGRDRGTRGGGRDRGKSGGGRAEGEERRGKSGGRRRCLCCPHARAPSRDRRRAPPSPPPPRPGCARSSWRVRRLQRASTRSDNPAPSASLGRLEAQAAAPTPPRAPPAPRGGFPWPQELASGRPKVEGAPLSTPRTGRTSTPRPSS